MGDIKGMVLHLYKHLDSSMFDTSELSKNDQDTERTYVAFGNFDRICFSPVENFVDYLSESSSAYRWIGGRKDIMLYYLEADEAQRRFVFGEKEDGFVQPQLFIKQNGEICQRKFLMVSMLYISGKAKASVQPYNVFLKYCKDSIYRVVNQANLALKNCGRESIICETFGTFNSSEIAILWGADQFAEVQYIVDQIRCMYFNFSSTNNPIPIFISSYSIIALTGVDFVAQDLLGGAMIQLAASTICKEGTLKEYNTSLAHLGRLCEEIGADKTNVDLCAGEYDYIIECIPPRLELLTKAKKEGVDGYLYAGNENFKNYFSQSTTRLFYRQENIDECLKSVDWKRLSCINVTGVSDYSECLQNNWGNIQEIAGLQNDPVREAYNNFRTEVLSRIQSTSSLGCNLDLLFSDYVQCMNITPDRQWAKDLKVQFLAAINVLNNLLQSELKLGDSIEADYIDQVRDIVSVLQKQISHVSDAGKLFFEEPCSHSKSTSQYDLLFHMFYGAIKQIIAAVYKCRVGKHFSKQSKLIPLIRFEPVPRIGSRLFLDMRELDERLVDIFLPYDAWSEPGQFIPLLIHELYHYVAPADRAERNETFAKILLVELNTGALQEFILQILKYGRSKKIEEISTLAEHEYKAAACRVTQEIRRLCVLYTRKIKISDMLGIKGDVQWTSFEEVFYKWCDGGNEDYVSGTSAYGVFLQELCSFICSCIKRKLSRDEVGSIDKIICEMLIDKLSISNTDDPNEPSLIDHLKEVREVWLPNIVKQLREILPDLGMVQQADIGISEYMLIFAIFQDKMQNTPYTLHETDVELTLRIGPVLDKLLTPKYKTAKDKIEALDILRDDFCRKYISYVKCCSWSKCTSRDEWLERAGQWFSFFKLVFEEYHANYNVFNDWMKNLIEQQYLPVCNEESLNISKSIKLYFEALANVEHSSQLFDSNISLVQTFQVQPFLEDLQVSDEEYTTKADDYSHSIHVRANWIEKGVKRDLYINSVDHINSPISIATGQLKGTHRAVFGTSHADCCLWYRGTKNASYDVLPSVMVSFLDDRNFSQYARKGENVVGTLWDYQKSILERFKYQADGALEIINSASYTTSDYIALLQHYGQPTTYLDWSEDVYSSLYFALESEILQEPKKLPKLPGRDAALYILDPMLYNRARKMLVNKVLSKCPEQFCPDDSWFHQQGRSIQEMPDGHIPNLSIGYNKRRYGMFSLDIPENADVNLTRKTKYYEVEGAAKNATLSQLELEMWNLPLAVYTSRLNPRIRSQSGQFIAFSPFSIPVYGTDTKKIPPADHFSYLSLLKIQEYFLSCFSGEEPFMYEIRISSFAKEELGRYFRDAGINRYRIYPELENIKL